MAKDDYPVIVYRVLLYLYKQLKSGTPPDTAELRPEGSLFNTNETYWRFILTNMHREGLITGLQEDQLPEVLAELAAQKTLEPAAEPPETPEESDQNPQESKKNRKKQKGQKDETEPESPRIPDRLDGLLMNLQITVKGIETLQDDKLSERVDKLIRGLLRID